MDLSKIKTEDDVVSATLEIKGYTEFDSRVANSCMELGQSWTSLRQ